MPRQLWIADVLAEEFRGLRGFRVDVYPGWQSRGSDAFDPVGVMDHHTGAGAYNNLLRYMAEGPVHPPLCNYATSRPDGGVVRVTVVAAGRANHAGVGELPWLGRNGGNRGTFGGEHQNSGSQPWPDQQVEAIRRAAAALLRRMGTDASRRTDHRIYGNRSPGWPGRKVDRHTANMTAEDRAVNTLIRGTEPAPTPAPPAPQQQEDDVIVSVEGQGNTAWHVVGGALVAIPSPEVAELIGGKDWRQNVKRLTAAQARPFRLIRADDLEAAARLRQGLEDNEGATALGLGRHGPRVIRWARAQGADLDAHRDG